ncbi:MAG: FAD-binding oxidoreductase [Dehalococcoidia bacterium]
MTGTLMGRLRGIVGGSQLLTDGGMRASYETDWTRRFGAKALAVVRPGSADEVASVLAACDEADVAVVPQGGNTGLVGGGVPRGGEVVLSTKRLAELHELDPMIGQAIAGAGMTAAALNEAASPYGLRLGVDLASRDSATVGGMAATNAGGINVLRYGMMRAQVAGMEVAFANGSVVSRMSGVGRDNTGYDLPGVMVGSEGTLGVVTALRLRLVPVLPSRAVALLAFDSLEAAIGVAIGARNEVADLQAAEMFLAEGLDLVIAHTRMPEPFGERWPFYVLLEAASRGDAVSGLAAALINAAGIRDSAMATEGRDRARLWAYRERHTESINSVGVPHKLDVALPLGRLQEFVERVGPLLSELSEEARGILFGHIAEGNVHVNVLGFDEEDERPDDAVLRLVASLGGSISAEHGVGVAKRQWLELTRSKADIAAMRALKDGLDPNWTMNPGVILERAGTRPAG